MVPRYYPVSLPYFKSVHGSHLLQSRQWPNIPTLVARLSNTSIREREFHQNFQPVAQKWTWGSYENSAQRILSSRASQHHSVTEHGSPGRLHCNQRRRFVKRRCLESSYAGSLRCGQRKAVILPRCGCRSQHACLHTDSFPQSCCLYYQSGSWPPTDITTHCRCEWEWPRTDSRFSSCSL